MAGLWLMSHPNDPSKMVQTVFQPTRKKSAGVGSFWWKHLGGLFYDFLVICGCAIFIAVFCRVGSVWVGSFLFQWKHGLSGCRDDAQRTSQVARYPPLGNAHFSRLQGNALAVLFMSLVVREVRKLMI